MSPRGVNTAARPLGFGADPGRFVLDARALGTRAGEGLAEPSKRERLDGGRTRAREELPRVGAPRGVKAEHRAEGVGEPWADGNIAGVLSAARPAS